ncbi:DMT family transporter [Cohnella sp. REN36]|uniref:DMT family transporter n=1 Tax=Cohnella sp. REN36 TaxID=2887347 RepID=UPI001D144116|nr:DMT family transporter [Cohnella sp. REN36]MCC3374165.1 DMT family transporter [Cohnella sp. REN36]
MPRLVYAALILLSLIWGGSFYFIKMLLHDFGPWSIVFLRSTAGLLTIVVMMLALRQPFGFRTIHWVPMAVMAIVNTALPWTLIAFGETKVASGMASILNATTPIWTVVIGMLVFRSKTHKLQWLGLGIATIGLLVVVGLRPGSDTAVNLLGVASLIVATICYAIGSQLSKRLMTGGLSMYQITFGTLLCTSIASGSVAFSTEPFPFVQLAASTNILMTVGLGVFGSGFGYILFYYMIQKGSAEFATMVTYLVPCTALVWGAALLDENMSWNLLVGLFVILAGVFLSGRKTGTGGRRSAT